MTRDRIVQAGALVVLAGGVSVSGAILPRLTEAAEEHVLRYTDRAVEGAPPIVALGTAIGALRGLIVDYLWIKIHLMKQEGQYYEVMADADVITQLQPRFSAVWAFHGHNMAYNISVAHNTEEERWEWVKRGIDLIRNKGLRYNPNDLQLHRELAYFFAHKIEGVSDDAHLYYKRELARQWNNILGAPPVGHKERIEWMKRVADAAPTLEEAERRTPGVKALVERLKTDLEPFRDRFEFKLDESFLEAYAQWEALTGQSVYAALFGFEGRTRQSNPVFAVFDAIAADPQYREAWQALLAHVRKRVLLDHYNMDPQLMYEYTRDYGPIDWRHGSAHALYWSLKGSQFGEDRLAVSENDVYRIVNNDRMKLQAMQDLARWGRISFDPFSNDWVSRFPDPRWIAVIDRYWEQYSIKHRNTRGTGADMFMAFHQNFLSSSVRELYRSGEIELAQHYLDRLNSLYGMGQVGRPDPKYAVPLDVFVWREIEEEYEYQPHLAPSDVAAALRYAFRVGIGQQRPEVYESAVSFANKVIEYFKHNNYNNFVTKLGSARLGALIDELEKTLPTVFAETIVDTTMPMQDRLIIWRFAPDDVKLPVYDMIQPIMAEQFSVHPLSQLMPLSEALPPPPGLEEYRIRRAAEQKQREQQTPTERSEVERK